MPFLRYPMKSAGSSYREGENEGSKLRKPLQILYAEDMEELREVASISLERDGHKVECAEDGVDALEKILAHPTGFDLVITDHHMPNMNGVELVMQLRAQAFPGKIMIFSSELSREINGAYQRLNVDRILYKPVFPSTLRQVLVDLYTPASAAPSEKEQAEA